MRISDWSSDVCSSDLVHRPWAGLDGAFGLQWAQRDFEAIGDEAFVPASQTRDTGLFWIGHRQFDTLRLELGARHDRNEIDIDNAGPAARPAPDFGTTSPSAALRWDLAIGRAAGWGRGGWVGENGGGAV